MRKFILLLMSAMTLLLAFKQESNFRVSGKVTNELGSPLPGVVVAVKGTSVRTVSLQDGTYQIIVPEKKEKLVFSFVGYKSQEVAIKGRAVIDVQMEPLVTSLNEVVVTGYSIKRKRIINGTVSNTQSQLLQGRAPGIAVTGRLQYDYHHNPSDFNTEDYDAINEQGFLSSIDNPLSTFSIDVDAASYANVRRYINNGELPPAGAVRIEEMINYFRYQYPVPQNNDPFSVTSEAMDCPWNKEHKLVLIGLQGRKIPVENLPPSNLVFLIDVSGSMQGPNRLDLVQSSLKMLVDQLREQDKVAIVVYAGAAGLVLPPTSGAQKEKIKSTIDELSAGGSTAGGEGIKLAYKVARENFAKEGNNRVILCTDGDFNVGVSSDAELEQLIEKERESGVYLTVLGYGMGNYKDNKMQKLADKGNGNHAYIDGIGEAKKVLVNEFGGTLFTIAKDVKLQVEFNPAVVQGYRLIGYENRLLNKEDFNDDKKDAGELGSGHTVTALYEVIPAGVQTSFLKQVDELKYSPKKKKAEAVHTAEMMTVKLRYKSPSGGGSKLLQHIITREAISERPSDNIRFAAAVAQLGLLLRNSEFKQNASYEHTLELAKSSAGMDVEGYRQEFIEMVTKASALNKKKNKEEKDTTGRK